MYYAFEVRVKVILGLLIYRESAKMLANCCNSSLRCYCLTRRTVLEDINNKHFLPGSTTWG